MARRHKPKAGAAGHTRNTRLAEQIRKDLALLVQRELNAGQVGLVTLTEVELSADYAHAKVYFTVMGAEPDVAATVLNEKAGWLHSLLFKMLHIHTVPTLHFIFDTHIGRALELTRLIEQANQDLKPSQPTCSGEEPNPGDFADRAADSVTATIEPDDPYPDEAA